MDGLRNTIFLQTFSKSKVITPDFPGRQLVRGSHLGLHWPSILPLEAGVKGLVKPIILSEVGHVREFEVPPPNSPLLLSSPNSHQTSPGDGPAKTCLVFQTLKLHVIITLTFSLQRQQHDNESPTEPPTLVNATSP